MKKSTTLKLYFILLSTVVIQNFTFACSCFYEPVFCRIVNPSLHIVRVTVIDHPADHLMRVSLIENINKEITADTITIYGQDGLTCGEVLNQFEIQDTLILAVSYLDFGGIDYWYLEGLCGLHFLRYENGVVMGKITDSLESQPIQDFKDNLFECLDMEVPTEEVIKKESINISPNPVSDILHLKTEGDPILDLEVFNLSGQSIFSIKNKEDHTIEFNTNNLNKGIYFVRIRTSKGILTRKFLKN